VNENEARHTREWERVISHVTSHVWMRMKHVTRVNENESYHTSRHTCEWEWSTWHVWMRTSHVTCVNENEARHTREWEGVTSHITLGVWVNHIPRHVTRVNENEARHTREWKRAISHVSTSMRHMCESCHMSKWNTERVTSHITSHVTSHVWMRMKHVTRVNENESHHTWVHPYVAYVSNVTRQNESRNQ